MSTNTDSKFPQAELVFTNKLLKNNSENIFLDTPPWGANTAIAGKLGLYYKGSTSIIRKGNCEKFLID